MTGHDLTKGLRASPHETSLVVSTTSASAKKQSGVEPPHSKETEAAKC